MTIEVEKSDITRIGHTCHSKDGFLEIFCKAFQLKYKRLTDEERTTLKRLFKRSPLIKNSGINFRRRPWK